MDFFFQCASLIGAVVLGIMVLTIFFKLLGRLERSKTAASLKDFSLSGVLDEKTVTTIHLSNGTVLEGVRFVGLTDANEIKGRYIDELHNMIVLEHADGRRTVLPPKAIRRIELPPGASI